MEDYLTGRPEAVRVDRILATVLFTDIVHSTGRAARMGDRRWLDLLPITTPSSVPLEPFRGREVKMTGDGIVAVFDGPARAVGCAAAITEQLAAIGLQIRAGIHTGEVEMRGGDVAGLGVHIASRVMSQAESGGILVSGTVKDLVVGSGIEFEPRGTFQLKGVPGEWALYELRSLARVDR